MELVLRPEAREGTKNKNKNVRKERLEERRFQERKAEGPRTVKEAMRFFRAAGEHSSERSRFGIAPPQPPPQLRMKERRRRGLPVARRAACARPEAEGKGRQLVVKPLGVSE